MKTIEELKAEQAKKLAELTKEHEIAALAPIPPSRAMLVSCGEAAWLTYKCATLWDAIDVMANYSPMVMHKYKGTFCRFQPECLNEISKHKGEEKGGPFIGLIRVHHGEGFGPVVYLTFFAQLGEHIVAVNCDIGDYRGLWNYGASFQAHDRGRKKRLDGQRYIYGDYCANSKLSAFADDVTSWGTGSDTSADHSYAIGADDFDGVWIDAKLRLENLAESMHGVRKEGLS